MGISLEFTRADFSRGDWKLVFEFFNLGVCIGEFNLSAFPYRDADKA